MMDTSKVNSLMRIVELYELLRTEGEVNAEQIALDYNKHVETIKKDIRFIKAALGTSGPEIRYDSNKKLYKFEEDPDRLFYCFILLTILYGSRSLPLQDLHHLTEFIFNSLKASERLQIKKITESYNANYVPMIQNAVLDCIRELYACILSQNIVEITYTNNDLATTTFPIAPLSIAYDEGYFYCIAYKNWDSEQPQIRNYRIDRILGYRKKRKKFTKLLDGSRFFEAGKYANLSFMMHSGERIIHATIRVKPFIANHLKSKFPVHRFLRKENDHEVYQVTVSHEESLLFWLLQQRTWAQVLSPQSLRDKMKEAIIDLARMYDVT